MPFLALPAEIRNHIYGSVFRGRSVDLCNWRYDSQSCLQKTSTPSTSALALLLVNRQILSEASLLFYDEAKFRACVADFEYFQRAADARRLSMLKYVEIDTRRGDDVLLDFIFRQLNRIPRLKTIRLNYWDEDFEAFGRKLITISYVSEYMEKVDFKACHAEKSSDEHMLERIPEHVMECMTLSPL